MVKLTDVADIKYGCAFDSKSFTDDDSYPQLVRIRDVKRGFSETFYKGEYSRDYVLSAGDLLVGMDGEFNIARWKVDGALLNQRICKIAARPGTYEEYLRFILGKVLKEIEGMTSFATVKHLSAKELNKLELDMPKYEEQIHRSSVLLKVEDIIDKRRLQLDNLDELVRARFVEMFGDPQINHFGWDVINISEVINGKVSNGFFAKRDDYVDDGNVSILGVSNIVNRMYSKIDGLPKTNANDKDIAKFEVKYGDMLFCRSSLVAEGIGKASIIPEDIQENVLFECHVIRLPLDLNKCVPEFMQTLSSMEYFRNQIIAQSKTATMTTIGQDGIIKTEIILPPINKQREYYQFIKEVNKSKLLSVSQPQIHIYKTLTLL